MSVLSLQSNFYAPWCSPDHAIVNRTLGDVQAEGVARVRRPVLVGHVHVGAV